MMDVLFLGTGSGVKNTTRAQTSLLVSEGNTRILIDAGQPTQKRLLEEKIDISKITAIILTHIHPDHTSGLPGILYEHQASGYTSSPPIYSERYTYEMLQKLSSIYNPSNYKIVLKELDNANSRILVEDLEVEFFPVRHSVPTIGIRVVSTNNGKCLFFSSDTSYLSSLKEKADCEIGIHEATIPVGMENVAEKVGFHTTPLQALDILENSKIKVLTHISDYTFKDPFVSNIHHIIAEDGMIIKI